jgi:diaminopimelate epimerase
MHALGNDFVVIDALTQRVDMTKERAKKIANRHTGIGCDQILLIDPPSNPHVDFGYRIFNQDGSEVSQCGNGARCFAKYVHDRKLSGKKNILVETRAGEMELLVNKDRTFSVALGIPNFEYDQIPYLGTESAIEINSESVEFSLVSLGNPHAVIQVPSVKNAKVKKIGKALQRHTNFQESVNVGFMEIVTRQEIRLRVYERGAGETLACGSGACAAVVAGIKNGLLDSAVTVNLALGKLVIEWPGSDQAVKLSGPATTVFSGQTRL